MKLKLLTKRQNQVMSILWNSKEPLSASQIHQADENLNMNTVQQVLRVLLNMKYIKVADIGYSSTSLTRLYAPTVSQADYIQFLLGDKSRFEITAYLINSNTNLDEINELKKLIDQKKKELEK